jgi:hypothetical protein
VTPVSDRVSSEADLLGASTSNRLMDHLRDANVLQQPSGSSPVLAADDNADRMQQQSTSISVDPGSSPASTGQTPREDAASSSAGDSSRFFRVMQGMMPSALFGATRPATVVEPPVAAANSDHKGRCSIVSYGNNL